MVARPRVPLHHGPARKLDHDASRSSHTRRFDDATDEADDEKKKHRALDPLDPSVRSTAQLAPPFVPAQAAEAAPPAQGGEVGARARVSLEELLPLVVRRIAWGGDKTKGAMQVELGAGAYAGTTVTVHAEGRRVRVELDGAGDLDALRRRIESRLRGAGVDVESVT